MRQPAPRRGRSQARKQGAHEGGVAAIRRGSARQPGARNPAVPCDPMGDRLVRVSPIVGVTLTTLVVLMLHLRRETLSAADRASGRAAFLDVSSLNFGGALTGVPPVFLLAPWQRIQGRSHSALPPLLIVNRRNVAAGISCLNLAEDGA
jgi:hypothetical protein